MFAHDLEVFNDDIPLTCELEPHCFVGSGRIVDATGVAEVSRRLSYGFPRA